MYAAEFEPHDVAQNSRLIIVRVLKCGTASNLPAVNENNLCPCLKRRDDRLLAPALQQMLSQGHSLAERRSRHSSAVTDVTATATLTQHKLVGRLGSCQAD